MIESPSQNNPNNYSTASDTKVSTNRSSSKVVSTETTHESYVQRIVSFIYRIFNALMNFFFGRSDTSKESLNIEPTKAHILEIDSDPKISSISISKSSILDVYGRYIMKRYVKNDKQFCLAMYGLSNSTEALNLAYDLENKSNYYQNKADNSEPYKEDFISYLQSLIYRYKADQKLRIVKAYIASSIDLIKFENNNLAEVFPMLKDIQQELRELRILSNSIDKNDSK